ncbi:hypothetical protein KP509_06G088200 [Ceratopteris richardii]|uniref:Uncharacterized protein n=1 Tax=Ceratopteris richardii TaxID=49495 RepID=A0A8T2UQ44_CERRI|nr:hypothetical protein KP509_06G088200 [Ceratopteris richardii]
MARVHDGEIRIGGVVVVSERERVKAMADRSYAYNRTEGLMDDGVVEHHTSYGRTPLLSVMDGNDGTLPLIHVEREERWSLLVLQRIPTRGERGERERERCSCRTYGGLLIACCRCSCRTYGGLLIACCRDRGRVRGLPLIHIERGERWSLRAL